VAVPRRQRDTYAAGCLVHLETKATAS
jgi:hypothetical protein